MNHLGEPFSKYDHTPLDVERFEIPYQEYYSEIALTPDMLSYWDNKDDLKDYLEGIHIRRFKAMLKLPAKVMQEKQVIAEYPATWVQAIRKRLGLRYRVIQVKLSEHLVFHTLKVPHHLRDKNSLYTEVFREAAMSDEESCTI